MNDAVTKNKQDIDENTKKAAAEIAKAQDALKMKELELAKIQKEIDNKKKELEELKKGN